MFVDVLRVSSFAFEGVVYRADKNQILVIKDRIMVKDFWKLPGGAGKK